MLGHKARVFKPLTEVSLEDLVPEDNFYDRQQLKPRIGVVFESQNLYERMSARENLRSHPRIYRADSRRVEEVLDSGWYRPGGDRESPGRHLLIWKVRRSDR